MTSEFPRKIPVAINGIDTHAEIAARAILDKALKLGIHVGAAPDGSELILVAPLKMPYETRRWFEIWLENFRDEAIAIITRENGGRS